jgi:hypothetical protein
VRKTKRYVKLIYIKSDELSGFVNEFLGPA